MKVFVFGNNISEDDSLPIKLLPALRRSFPDIEFIHADPTENWWQGEKELVILDTVVGINSITIFNSLDEFQMQNHVTPHDYDVYMDLQLLMKLEKIEKIKIIGIPRIPVRYLVQQIEKNGPVFFI